MVTPMRSFAVVLAVLLAPIAAPAATCTTGYVKVQLGARYPEALAAVRQACHPGDPVIWPADYTALIAATCDGRRAVSRSGGNVVCTLNRP